MPTKIRQIISDHAKLTTNALELPATADLYQAGLTSHASVNLMLALEDAFDIEFPERMLRRKTFETIANIQEAIEELAPGASA